MVDGVIEAPGGAHFTECPPDYGRDEAFQKRVRRRRAATTPRGPTFRARFLDVDEADYQRAVRALPRGASR